MPRYRASRLAELIHKELARRLRTEVKDPRLVDLSITGVELTPDLRRADIHYMPLGGGEIGDDLVDALDDVARALRGPIGRALRVRYSPELVFHPDEHTEAAFRVTRILDELRAGRDTSEEES